MQSSADILMKAASSARRPSQHQHKTASARGDGRSLRCVYRISKGKANKTTSCSPLQEKHSLFYLKITPI